MAFALGDWKSHFVSDFQMIDQYAGSGTLWSWGQNNYGQLGINNITHRSSPVQTISTGTNWKQLSSALVNTAAIKTDGTLWLWGRNAYGNLGTNDRTNRSSPVQTVAGGTNWKQVSNGGSHAAAIKTDGTLWLWGSNFHGALGNNAGGSGTSKSSPVQTISGGNNWKFVSADATDSTLAIKTDGTLWAWGYNNYGQLGDNTITKKSSPVQTVAGGTNWKTVSLNLTYVSAIKTDGTLWLWGNNDYGQLGTNNITNRSSPVQTVAGGTNWKIVSGGLGATAAIKTDGTLWMWGNNNYGQLGDNTITRRSSPVQTISGGTNWKQVSVKWNTTAAIKTDGTLWTWGLNNYGQLGTNNITNRSSPVQTVTGGTNWKQVSSGQLFTAAVKYGYTTD